MVDSRDWEIQYDSHRIQCRLIEPWGALINGNHLLKTLGVSEEHRLRCIGKVPQRDRNGVWLNNRGAQYLLALGKTDRSSDIREWLYFNEKTLAIGGVVEPGPSDSYPKRNRFCPAIQECYQNVIRIHYDGRDPFNLDVRILSDDGERLPVYAVDHWYGRHQNGLNDGVATSTGTNRSLGMPNSLERRRVQHIFYMWLNFVEFQFRRNPRDLNQRSLSL